jgi:hypothetical protein
MSDTPIRRLKRRQFWTAGKLPLGHLVIAACGTVTDDDAGRKGVEWFENELGRIGYARGSDETWAIPPRKLTPAIQGDALEVEIKGITVTGTRAVTLDVKAHDQAITWRGQVYLKYASRERYHRNGAPLDWSAWKDIASILNVEQRSRRWYVQRVR